MNVVCFTHRLYRGETTPTLSCRNCCVIFLQEMKRRHEDGEPIPHFDFDKAKRNQSVNVKRPKFSLVKTPESQQSRF
jgi:hypothetical protein